MAIPEVQLIEIDKIRFDPAETQARVRINDESIKEYIEAYREGANFPPVVCYFDGKEYWLADGFHRVLAAKQAGYTDIAVDVQRGTKEDAKWHAAGANVSHGIRRTNADKRKAVEFALAVHPEYTSRAIAKHVGVGHTVVDDIRNQLASDANSTNLIDSINKVEKRIGADGKSYPVKREIPPPPPDPNEPPENKNAGSQLADSANSTPPPPPPPKPPRILDEIGNDVPERCQELWTRRQEAQDILTAVSRLRSAIQKAREDRDPLWAEVRLDSAEAEASTLYNTLAQLKPYAVCAYCGGMTAECRACKGRGLVSRHAFNAYTTKEAREYAIAAGQRNKAAAA